MTMSPKPERISSDLTLMLKFFIPVFWTVFFGALTLAFWLTPMGIDYKSIRIIYSVILVSGVIVLYFTVFQLKRVEIHPEYIFITNYFKYYRYFLRDIEKITFKKIPLFTIGSIILKEKGSLGKKIFFIASKSRLKSFLKDYSNQIIMEE